MAATKEASLIETIKIISIENTKLTLSLESIKMKMMSQKILVDRKMQTEAP